MALDRLFFVRISSVTFFLLLLSCIAQCLPGFFWITSEKFILGLLHISISKSFFLLTNARTFHCFHTFHTNLVRVSSLFQTTKSKTRIFSGSKQWASFALKRFIPILLPKAIHSCCVCVLGSWCFFWCWLSSLIFIEASPTLKNVFILLWVLNPATSEHLLWSLKWGCFLLMMSVIQKYFSLAWESLNVLQQGRQVADTSGNCGTFECNILILMVLLDFSLTWEIKIAKLVISSIVIHHSLNSIYI